MNSFKLAAITPVISYIEAHLQESLRLDAVARAAGYSKYHLHRMFTRAVGITPHDYIRRRRLTEAARLLVRSETPVNEIAWLAGYESQQAFTTVFKSMYKQTPLEYRNRRFFYPLQLTLTLPASPSSPAAAHRISCATTDDIPDWMDFLSLVIDGFPRLEETAHMARVRTYIESGQALIVRDGPNIAGAAAFSEQSGTVDFLAAHPLYRRYGVAKALLDYMIRRRFTGREISITTFRAGDKADTGQREAYKRLGFAEAELVTAFGYPAQRLVLPLKRENDGNG